MNGSSLKKKVLGLNSRFVTDPLCFSILIHCLLSVSQILIDASSEPEASVMSSSEIARQFIFCLNFFYYKIFDFKKLSYL